MAPAFEPCYADAKGTMGARVWFEVLAAGALLSAACGLTKTSEGEPASAHATSASGTANETSASSTSSGGNSGAGGGAGGSAGAASSDEDEGTQTEYAGAAGEPNDEQPVVECDAVGMVTPFECEAELCAPADLLTVVEQIDPEALFSDLRAILDPWIDESCLQQCEPSFEEECTDNGTELVCESAACQEADCTTSRAAHMEYSRTETYGFTWSDDYEGGSTETREHVVIRPAAGDEGWSELELSWRQSDTFDHGRWIANSISVSWVGVLRPDWPSDFSGEFSFSGNGAEESAWEMQAPACSMSYRHYRDFWSLAREDQLLEVRCASSGLGGACHAELDAVCLGEVDPDTFEVVGACP